MTFIRKLKPKEIGDWYITLRSGDIVSDEIAKSAYRGPGLYKQDDGLYYFVRYSGPAGLRKFGVVLK